MSKRVVAVALVRQAIEDIIAEVLQKEAETTVANIAERAERYKRASGCRTALRTAVPTFTPCQP
jgi:hypothetical protein